MGERYELAKAALLAADAAKNARITQLEAERAELVSLVDVLRKAEATTSTGNGRGGRKITLDFEAPADEVAAYERLVATLSRIAGEV